jgi:nucleotide-binding universal stress UspA family protein
LRRLAGVTHIECESRRGEVAQMLIDIAQERSAEAIIVGKRGAGRVAGCLAASRRSL